MIHVLKRWGLWLPWTIQHHFILPLICYPVSDKKFLHYKILECFNFTVKYMYKSDMLHVHVHDIFMYMYIVITFTFT